mgnify:CR=1 FL=1
MLDVTAEIRCGNCGAEFADHNYVKDSIDKYVCPHSHVECGYGYFKGGDPRKFSPDGDACSPDEISNHKASCDLWNDMESKGKTPSPEDCPSGWIYDTDGKTVAHVLVAPYGIGVYSVEFEQYFDARDFDDQVAEEYDFEIDFEEDEE